MNKKGLGRKGQRDEIFKIVFKDILHIKQYKQYFIISCNMVYLAEWFFYDNSSPALLCHTGLLQIEQMSF